MRSPVRDCGLCSHWCVRPSLARPLSTRGRHSCDQPFVADPHAVAVGCGCRLRESNLTSAWAVSSVIDAADLYAHSVLSQADLAKKRSKIATSFPRCTTTIKNRS
ncbi:hypothetical protein BHE74_00040566 [Ensete ventricosum]|nr:hypothetical protein BHE74_00040566 [Ensete ventricosum]